MRNKQVLFLAQAAMVAAIYVALTFVSSSVGLSSGTIQVRISEALCILPVFTPAAIPGLWLGCFLANLLTGCILVDVICGSVATLIGAVGTYLLRKHKLACMFPPVIANMVVVPFVLRYGYGVTAVYHGTDWSIPFHALTVGIGEAVACIVLGSILKKALSRYRNVIFMQEAK
ncbi:MAG: QueT transporter family protein [Lachnospiraceae bacterium]|jgi:uncharacterized membrane protein|nr:QueT transporter family protein [Lachnospiraceae bacterium]